MYVYTYSLRVYILRIIVRTRTLCRALTVAKESAVLEQSAANAQQRVQLARQSVRFGECQRGESHRRHFFVLASLERHPSNCVLRPCAQKMRFKGAAAVAAAAGKEYEDTVACRVSHLPPLSSPHHTPPYTPVANITRIYVLTRLKGGSRRRWL